MCPMICRSFTSTRFGHSGLFPALLPFSYFGEGKTVILWLALLLITFHSSSCCPVRLLVCSSHHFHLLTLTLSLIALVQSSSCLEPNHPSLCVRKNLTAILSFCLSDSPTHPGHSEIHPSLSLHLHHHQRQTG